MRLRYHLFCAIAALLVAPCALAGQFNARVKPLLSQHCFACHGPDAKQRKGDLRLDVPPEAAGLDGQHAGEIFGEGRANSEIFARISAADPADRMPPEEKPALKPEEIEIIGAWLDAGAPYEKHWAFLPPAWPEAEESGDSNWSKGTLDDLILADLRAADLEPAPLADPVTQIRRVYLDLTGIPPSIEAVDAFVADPSDVAYEAAVDELLASPHFGERWARHWLDQARYADSNGYSIDGPRDIWPYRDWVINAINADKPFDDFVVEQLAGDLLPEATRDQIVATGFNRNTMINQEGGIDKEEFRIEAVVDRVNTTGSVFLGLTLGCAKCHDHKYDPVYQKEYYQLFAFFNDDDEVDQALPTPEQAAQKQALQTEIDAIVPERDAYRAKAIAEKLPVWLAGLDPAAIKDWHLKEQDAVQRPIADWTDEQRRMMEKRYLGTDAEFQAFEKSISEIQARMPSIVSTMVLSRRAEPRETHIFEKGDFTRKGDVVTPGTPGVLHPLHTGETATRLDLARWIVDRGNPLTARVTVNRYWQELFGRGLVETENDFGYQGALPVHPEVLDYLANRFIARGWSVKAILKEIVLSATYRQASTVRPELDVVDPKNYLLARQNRVRLDAEVIRDATLVVSGLLDETIGGPGVHPPQPDGVMKLGQSARAWETSTDSGRFRRGMYTYFWRATPYPSLVVFDAPNAMMACTRRSRSNTPLQALTLLNDAAFFEQAEAFAKRIAEAPMDSDSERLEFAFRTCVSRPPADHERDVLQNLLDAAKDQASPEGKGPWLMVARALLNLDEFITRE